MNRARLNEIFASVQGEGPWIGERHIFIRFQGCDIRCRYCDTPSATVGIEDLETQYCMVQASTGPGAVYEKILNPISAHLLTELCSRLVIPGPSRSTISLTGGEPLTQLPFLLEWLPSVKEQFLIYLETNGIHDEAMMSLHGLVDVVSMDFKLPSATGLRSFWDEHQRFLSAAGSSSIFIKAVVTRDTSKDDVLQSARLIAMQNNSIPFILQPAGGPLAPDSKRLIDFQEAALRTLKDVRIIPQAHKILKVP
jgi:7-carboxy-7-deazaguanine synthase